MIVADIEGSSGCWDYEGSRFLTEDWAEACKAMSLDVDAVVRGLFDAGVDAVVAKDFHRTGYNLLPELIDSRAEIVHGYKIGSVPGIGNPVGVDALMFVGLHAASGTTGFLAHTLTSRISRLEVNGAPLSEVQLFASSLAKTGAVPLFFSGCPLACVQAEASIRGIQTYYIDKAVGRNNFDAQSWRTGLAEAAAASLTADDAAPYRPAGPFSVKVSMRDGEKIASKIADRWKLDRDGSTLEFEASDFHALYSQLIRIAYLNPVIEKVLPFGLPLYNMKGRYGLAWVRGKIRAADRVAAKSG